MLNTKLIKCVIILLGLLIALKLPVFQSTNLTLISWFGIDKRLAVHRVNDLSKLATIGTTGLQSIEFDLIYRQPKREFEVAHDDAASVGLMLSSYVSKIPDSVNKLWLDVKNVDANNIQLIVEAIKESFVSPNIESLIFESSFDSPLLSYASDNGLYTSFYLPTEALLKLQRSNDEAGKLRTAQLMSKQLEAKKVQAISFDLRLYPYVKNYLEPELTKPLDFHIWVEKRLHRGYFLPQLLLRDYYRDEKVKTILFRLNKHQ